MKNVIHFSIACIGVVAFACGSNEKSNSSKPIVAPTLSSIQQEVFDVRCSAPSCHGSGMKGDLSLVGGNSYGQVVAAAATADRRNLPPFLRVKPGSPDSSFLYIKITLPDSDQGEIMPKGGEKLTQQEIDAIRQWIIRGALND